MRQKIYNHDRKIERFLHNFDGNFFHPVWLFYGASGVGKFSVAQYLCEKILDFSVEKGVLHPDCHIVNDVDVETINSVISKMHQYPVLARHKVLILNNMQNYSAQSMNCILKIIEEPPLHSVIIMISDDIRAILPTILSRCQKMHFNGISNKNMQKIFADRGIMNDAALAVAMDSVGDAFLLHECNFFDKYKDFLLNSQKLRDFLSCEAEKIAYIIMRRVLFILLNKSFDIPQYLLDEEKEFVNKTKINIDKMHELWCKINIYKKNCLQDAAIIEYFINNFLE